MVIDKAVVITGSCNFAKAGDQNNAETLLVIRSMDLGGQRERDWEKYKKHENIT
jgi:phosphatidylserine/phosphatidylglycerophosphate/cardiolipin synthase-like enzyme